MIIFQMEPTPTCTLQAEQQQQPVQTLEPLLNQIMSLVMYMPIEDLIEDYHYEVVFVDRWFDDIFVVLNNCLIDEFNLIRLPQSYHESLTRFLGVLQSNNVQNLYIEYLGSAHEGRPLPGNMAAGLAHTCGDNPLSCVRGCMCVQQSTSIFFLYPYLPESLL